MKKLLVAVVALGLVASSVIAGEAKNVNIKTDVKNASNVAIGKRNVAEQNIHSLDVGHGGKVKNVNIKGKARNVNNIAIGKGNRAKQNVGSVKVR